MARFAELILLVMRAEKYRVLQRLVEPVRVCRVARPTRELSLLQGKILWNNHPRRRRDTHAVAMLDPNLPARIGNRSIVTIQTRIGFADDRFPRWIDQQHCVRLLEALDPFDMTNGAVATRSRWYVPELGANNRRATTDQRHHKHADSRHGRFASLNATTATRLAFSSTT